MEAVQLQRDVQEVIFCILVILSDVEKGDQDWVNFKVIVNCELKEVDGRSLKASRVVLARRAGYLYKMQLDKTGLLTLEESLDVYQNVN